MFTLKVFYRETRQEEFVELDESFKIIPAEGDEEYMTNLKEQFPEATMFVVTNKYTIPVLKSANYEILNSRGNVIKTLY